MAIPALCAATISNAQDATPSPPEPASYRAYTNTADCKPVWPKSSIRNEESGAVTLAFLVDADGKLLDSKVVRSSGFRDLDNAAHFALRNCTFHPAIENGKPVQSWMNLVWIWKMQ